MRLEPNPYNFVRCLPRMSWSPKNLYNLWRRSPGGDHTMKVDFTHMMSITPLFRQRWKAKTLARAYHGDQIGEKIFRRWYVPKTLPDVRPKKITSQASIGLKQWARKDDVAQQERKRLEAEEQKGVAPVGSLMFTEVERRIDVLIFRACMAPSVWDARRMVVHGAVLLNGIKHTNANTRLAPGDMISVDPKAITFLQPPRPSAVAKPDSQSEDTSEKSSGDGAAASSSEPQSSRKESQSKYAMTPFNLPPYAAPWIFIPAYLEVSFATCSFIFLRLPTARPEYSEIPTPYDADGDVMRLTWEWYSERYTRVRSVKQFARMPENRGFVAPTKRM